MLSDGDEWDYLDDQTLKKTIKNDPTGHLEIGDKVIVASGHSKGVKGEIVALEGKEFSKYF